MDETEPREFIEARVLLADWQLEKFLSFCEKELDQLPDLSRIPPEQLNGYKEFLELAAANKDQRLFAKVGKGSRN